MIAGKVMQVEGKAQDAVGDITGNTDDDVAGKTKQVEGKVQEEFGKAKDALRAALDK